MFNLRVLGSGIVAPTAIRYPVGYFIETQSGLILLECNGTALTRLMGFGFNYTKVHTICVSHEHNDHSGGLCHFLEAISAKCAINEEEMTHVTVIGPAGLKENLHHDFRRHWPELKADDPFHSSLRVIEGRKGILGTSIPFNQNQPQISFFAVNHVPNLLSVGFRIEYEGKVIVYPGDFGNDQFEKIDELLPHLKDADLLVLPACAQKPSPTHLTAAQAMDIQKRCGAKELLISHIPTHLLEKTTHTISVARNANVAYDGILIELVA